MMNSPDMIDQIFWDALALGSEEERGAYLDRACGAHPEQRQLVEKLLRAQPRAAGFLERPLAMSQGTIDEPITERPGTIIGPYKLLEQIGEGGMGLVFVAEQQQPVKRRVALKIIKPGMDSRQVVARFEAERQALAMMDHPNIAKVFDGGCTGGEPGCVSAGRPYFVMELVKGTSITDYCDANRRTTRERLELFLDVCHAVQHAHQKGIIHRDLKPSNVLVTVHDVSPVVKVIDFGIAKATSGQLTDKTVYTQIAHLIGTPMYMSPEQAGLSGLDVDTRSDVYSLGVLLYELLTGTTPFDSETLKKAGYDEMRRIIREEEPPKPSTRVSTFSKSDRVAGAESSKPRCTEEDRGFPSFSPGHPASQQTRPTGEAHTTDALTIAAHRKSDPLKLSRLLRGELDLIVMKALEKDRGQRYESASAFAADVQRYLDDEPVQACPPSKIYRLRKFVRRHKAGLGVAAVLLLAVLLAGSSWLWWARQQAGAEGEARVALQEAVGLQEAERWPEALSAAQRAEGVLAGFGADAGLRRQVHVLIEDLGMARALQEAQLRGTSVKDGHFDNEASALAYADAFREYGLDVDGLDPGAAAEQIRARSIHRRLVAALDQWAECRWLLKAEGWRHLLAVARAADPDHWRNRLRDALERKDPKAVEELAAAGLEEEWPVQTLELLAVVAYKTRLSDRIVMLLKRAQQRRPDDFWINQSLVRFFEESRPRRLEEEIRYASIAVALQPQSPGAHINLGQALGDKGQLDEAIAEYRAAIRLKNDYAEAHVNLGAALAAKGQLDEAIAEYREAIRLNKDLPSAHNNLALALDSKGDKSGAVAEYREAIRLKNDFAEAHNGLGVALAVKGQLDEAIAEFREAIRPKKGYALAHYNLGIALKEKGQLDEAIAEYRETIRLKKDYAEAHYNLGNGLKDKGQLDEAIAEYREAIRFKEDYAEAHCNLGYYLRSKGEFAEALSHLRRGHELGLKNPYWSYPSAKWVKQCECMVELAPKLHKVLKGEVQPADAGERMALAQMCQQYKGLYVASLRFYREAFAEQPTLANDLSAGNRYNAACVAALAGCGQGKDADQTDDKQRARFRGQARDWLRADLAAWQKVLEEDPDKVGPDLAQTMRHWQQDTDFAGVRGPEALAKLPEAERQEWQKLWADIEETLKEANHKDTNDTKKKPSN